MPEKKEKPTIGMLLDIEHLYGNSESRLGPWVASLLLGGAPALIYVYFGLFTYVPIWLFLPINIFWVIRVIMKIQGREDYRMMIFKRQLYDKYVTSSSLMNIKTIYADGCIEYVNGTIMYLVASFNGTCESEVRRSVELRKFMQNLLGDYLADIYIHNITMVAELRDYYNRVSRFGKNESAKNFIKIIDYTLSLTEDTSMVQCTIFAIKGRRSEWKDMKHQIDVAVKSKVAKVYKTVYRIKDVEEINSVLDRDIDTTVNISELLRNKYKTEDYGSSSVLAYDLDADKIIEQGKSAVKPIIPEQTASSFHVVFEEDSNE